MLKLLPLTAAECASSTPETTSENQRKSKISHLATGGQTARIPGITRFSIPVHSRSRRGLLAEEIARSVDPNSASARVTSLACGPGTEIFNIFDKNPGAQLQLTLIDIDRKRAGVAPGAAAG